MQSTSLNDTAIKNEINDSHPLNKIWVVIPAAGAGRRFGSATPKQYMPLAGKTVIWHTVNKLLNSLPVYKVIIAIDANDDVAPVVLQDFLAHIVFVTGGQERVHSVLAGLYYANQHGHAHDIVFVHDAARPCVESKHLKQLYNYMCIDDGLDTKWQNGAILAIPVRDTLKKSTNNPVLLNNNLQPTIDYTIDRSHLWQAQTPQTFYIKPLFDALNTALQNGNIVTDEASAIEYVGGNVALIEGNAQNLKITYAQDLDLAELILQNQLSR